jgi:hypothetical protein
MTPAVGDGESEGDSYKSVNREVCQDAEDTYEGSKEFNWIALHPAFEVNPHHRSPGEHCEREWESDQDWQKYLGIDRVIVSRREPKSPNNLILAIA